MAITSVEKYELPVQLQTMHNFVTDDWNKFKYPSYDSVETTLKHIAKELDYNRWIESEHKSWLPIYVTGIDSSSYYSRELDMINLLNLNIIDEFYSLKQKSESAIYSYSVFYIKAHQFKKLKPLAYKKFIDLMKK